MTPDFNYAVLDLVGLSTDARNQVGQCSHIVEGHGGAGGAQHLGMARLTMAATVETEHGHPGGDGRR